MVRLGFKPSGKTVAIIGPDGSGKSTLINNLERQLPSHPKRIYMGINPEATTHALPTTRLMWFLKRRLNKPLVNYETVRNHHEDNGRKPPKKLHKKVFANLKSTFFVINRMSEEWYRQWVSWYYQWQGKLVLYDRHFYIDYAAIRIMKPDEDRSLPAWRIHDFLLERVYPKPDLTLYLDAPPEVLYARKQEVSVERLEEMRTAYRQLNQRVPCFTVLDATLSADEVFETARQAINNMTK